MKKKRLFSSLVIVAGLMAYSAMAQADTLRIAAGVPPAHPAYDPLYTDFQIILPQVSDNRLDAEILGLEIVNLPGMRDGIKSGLVDVGLFLPAYFPADLPEVNLVGDMAFLGNNAQAMAAAMTEYVATCTECQAEMKRLGIVFASSHSTNTYGILSKTPIVSAEDMMGKRLRTGGPQFSRWVEDLGGAPQQIPVGETFESLSQGIIDGTVASAADIVSFRLDEVIGYVTQVNLGTYHSTISHAIRADKWASMSPADRKAVVLASARTSAITTQRWQDITELGLKRAKDAGIEVVVGDSSLVTATAAFVEADLEAAAKTALERNNIQNASAKIARFQTLIEKWEKIAEQKGDDPVKMGEAMEKEIWDPVDFSQYGL